MSRLYTIQHCHELPISQVKQLSGLDRTNGLYYSSMLSCCQISSIIYLKNHSKLPCMMLIVQVDQKQQIAFLSLRLALPIKDAALCKKLSPLKNVNPIQCGCGSP